MTVAFRSCAPSCFPVAQRLRRRRPSLFGGLRLAVGCVASLLVALSTGCASGPPQLLQAPEITWVGTYTRSDGPLADVPGESFFTVNGFKFSERTTRVPAVIGTRFGMRFKLPAPYGRAVTFRKTWQFPRRGLLDPRGDGWPYIRQTSQGACGGPTECFVAWSIDEPWEQVPGIWKVEILLDEKVVLSQDFEVYGPDGLARAPGPTVPVINESVFTEVPTIVNESLTATLRAAIDARGLAVFVSASAFDTDTKWKYCYTHVGLTHPAPEFGPHARIPERWQVNVQRLRPAEFTPEKCVSKALEASMASMNKRGAAHWLERIDRTAPEGDVHEAMPPPGGPKAWVVHEGVEKSAAREIANMAADAGLHTVFDARSLHVMTRAFGVQFDDVVACAAIAGIGGRTPGRMAARWPAVAWTRFLALDKSKFTLDQCRDIAAYSAVKGMLGSEPDEEALRESLPGTYDGRPLEVDYAKAAAWFRAVAKRFAAEQAAKAAN
jgi:hypothetical protein